MQVPEFTTPSPAGRNGTPHLSPCQRTALGHLAEGRSTAQIAAAMSISRNTARSHVQRLRARLDVADRDQVVQRARRLGLV
jgi:DNA-binding CsgD family transcriptional regulator